MKKFFLLAVAVCGVVASCTKEQTSMSLDDIKDSAKISGTIVYSEGTGQSGNIFSELVKPAADITVTAKIPNSSLSPNGNANGFTYLKTTTDANGYYEFTVPVVDKNYTMPVYIKPDSFIGTRHLIEGFDDYGNVIWNDEEVIFEVSDAKQVNVSPNDIKIQDIAYGFITPGADQSYPETVALNITVGKSAYAYDSENSNRIAYLAAAGGVHVILDVKYRDYTELTTNETLHRIYALTTDGNGEAFFNIPAKESTVYFQSITATILPYDGTMTYYDRAGERYTVNGTYALWQNGYFYYDGVINPGIYYIDKETSFFTRMVLDPDSDDNSGYYPSENRTAWNSTELGFNN